MSDDKTSLEKGVPVFKFKTSELLNRWFGNTTEAAEDEPTEPELEARTDCLGLGAKVPRQINCGPSDDPVGRKLQAKLGVKTRKTAKRAPDSTPSSKIAKENESDDDNEQESKSQAFSKKKRAVFRPAAK